jgi:hypothetical protein
MPAYLVFSATEPSAPMSFEDRNAAISWCRLQPGHYKVVEVPNERGNLVQVDPTTARPVFQK